MITILKTCEIKVLILHYRYNTANWFCILRFNELICHVPGKFHFSDGVLNPNGVRFGSAEIYNVGKNIASFSIYFNN